LRSGGNGFTDAGNYGTTSPELIGTEMISATS